MNKTREWAKARKKLKEEFEEQGITYCEITAYEYKHHHITRKQAIERNRILSFHHRHKRIWYYSQPELLGDSNQVLLLGAYYHNRLEYNAELTKKWFEILRDQI